MNAFSKPLSCRPFPFVAFLLLTAAALAEPLPIDPLWKSAAFRRVFTASYGIDARIEPTITTTEKGILEAMASELAAEDRAGAIAKLTSSSLLSTSAVLIFNLGNLRFEEGKSDDAIENFQKAIERYPNFRDAHRNLAVALVQQGKVEEAETHLVRAAELGAQDGLSFGLLGFVHLSKERYTAALQAYRMAQVTMPEEGQWKVGEAEALLALGAYQEAESLFGHLLETRPQDPGIWLNQANIWLQTDDATKALANLEWVRRMGALSADGLLTLGHLYLGKRLPLHALSTWEEALQAEPPAPLSGALGALEHLLNRSLWPQGQTFAQQIEEALTIPAESLDASRLSRAKALIEFETGDRESAVVQLQDLIRINPVDGPALLLLARFQEREKKIEEAIHLLEQAAHEENVRAEALLLHGQILVDRGDFTAALPLLEEVLLLQPGEPLAAYVGEIQNISDTREIR
ncbi:MAG: tetratricopeptide repeat protein [Verrucomicrobiota bacterium]